MKINLETNCHVDEVLKAYLKENASETLAEKINNGVKIVKDGKTLLSKKTLEGFMRFATDEAKKLAEKGAQFACVKDKVVFGWLIHYFEEDSIEGELFNPDGSKYEKQKPIVTSKRARSAKPVEPSKPKDTQLSLFDAMFEGQEETETKSQNDGKIGTTDDETEVVDAEQGEPETTAETENLRSNESTKTATEVVTRTRFSTPVCGNIEHTPQVSENFPDWYKRYLEIQSQHKGSLLLMRLGDFYEMFDETATAAADILDLTLTSRRITDKERTPLCGVPCHAVDNYIAKLLSGGYSVIICDHNGSNVRVFNPKVEEKQQDSKNCYDEETDDYVDIYEQEKDLQEEIDRLSPDETEAYLNISDDEIDEDGVVHNEEYRLLAEIAQILQINIILR